jgi:hypothetical protein
VAIMSNQNIFWLQIAVQDSVLMHVLQRY